VQRGGKPCKAAATLRPSGFIGLQQGGLRTRPYPDPTIRHSPFAIRRFFPLAARHSPLAARRSSPLAIRYSPFAIRGLFAFAIRRFFSARHSPFATRRLSALAVYPFALSR
jgi:hypothetical protein